MLFKALLPCNTSPSTDVKPLESAVRLIAVLAARLFLGQKSMKVLSFKELVGMFLILTDFGQLGWK